jgi:hypothetical protein
LKRESEKSLSSKVLINKEDFGIVDVVLDEIRFRFNGCWVDFLLIFVVFDDMRCDKGVGESGMGDLVDFVGGLGFLMVKF